ncbi:hypothetical protein [Paenibacillus massiliensis]|uniref:hypothetical protein n=1 Tax=Paenibacillus massiliensis TaxID=225917 RepID=UPI0012EBC132|nr:hypothetical protein [Paenibacillus massiliensis]
MQLPFEEFLITIRGSLLAAVLLSSNQSKTVAHGVMTTGTVLFFYVISRLFTRSQD